MIESPDLTSSLGKFQKAGGSTLWALQFHPSVVEHVVFKTPHSFSRTFRSIHVGLGPEKCESRRSESRWTFIESFMV